MRVAALLLGLLAAGPAFADRLRLVQLSPEGEPILGFELACGAARCSGTGQLLAPEGLIWVEGEARREPDRLLLVLRAEGADISTPGALPIELRDGRALLDVPLVRGWRPEPGQVLDGAYRRSAWAGIRLRAAFGP